MLRHNLRQSLLTQQDELFRDVLSSRDAPEIRDIESGLGLDFGFSTATEDESAVAAPTMSNAPLSSIVSSSDAVSQSKQRKLNGPSGMTTLFWKSISLCCACTRTRHAQQKKVVTCANAQQQSDQLKKRQENKEKRKLKRREREKQLRAKLLRSKKYAAYLKDCHATLLQRLTSDEGKKLIKQMAKDENKPVAQVVEHMVKGLEAQAIRQYIKNYKDREKKQQAKQPATQREETEPQEATPSPKAPVEPEGAAHEESEANLL